MDVLKHRDENLATLTKRQRRMRVWIILSKKEEDNYLKARSKSSYLTSMPVGEEVMINDTPTYVHHIDDQGSWKNDPILHPQFIPVPKPKEG